MEGYGRILKAERVRAGMTQDEACERLGISQVTLRSYESGATDAPADVLMSMSDMYGCSIDWLLGRTDMRNTREVV